MESNTDTCPSVTLAPPVKIDAQYRPIWCFVCEATTTHELDGNVYRCECGYEIDYHINVSKPMMAIDLHQSAEAIQRFEEWSLEQL